MADQFDAVINRLLEQFGIRGVKVVGAGTGAHGGAEAVHISVEQSIDQSTIDRALAANDQVAMVILLNLEIEHQLNGFFRTLLGEPKFKARYDTLISMLRALRFENGLYDIVDGFRKLRNKFAHEKADLGDCVETLDQIFAAELPTLTGSKVLGVEGVSFADLPTIVRLHAYARLTILFLAGANQMYSFQKPGRRFQVISPSGKTD